MVTPRLNPTSGLDVKGTLTNQILDFKRYRGYMLEAETLGLNHGDLLNVLKVEEMDRWM